MSGERGPIVVALTSVLAAIGLTIFKLVVGISTGSLGILSEFAHSGLDLVAALITLFAVRAAARPADAEHLYGHGKLESFSALIETLLLLGTCIWIAYEAVSRLLVRPMPVEATAWSFVVMGVSIVVDVSRSRALSRAAHRYRSQALEADALHFSTDVWSSGVVILGLIAVRLGELTTRPDWFWRADSVAALGVAAVATYVGLRLGRRTFDVLVDRAPAGMHERLVDAVRAVPGVVACERVRVRAGGATTFVDVNVQVDAAALEEAHRIAHDVEHQVREICGEADVMVHTDPGAAGDAAAPATIRRAALRRGLAVHSVAAHVGPEGLHVTLHLEVDRSSTLTEARRVADDFEQDVRRELPALARLDTHLEPHASEVVNGRRPMAEEETLHRRIHCIALAVELVRDCHDVHVDTVDGVREVALHCTFDPDLPMGRVHEVCHQLEERLRAEIPELGRVSVQAEPPPK